MTNHKNSFPESIKVFLNQVISLLREDRFFTGEDIPEGYHEQAEIIFYNTAGHRMMKNFVNGDDICFESEQELEDCLKDTVVESCMMKLMDQNLLNGIEDEKGEFIYWLTPEGKEAGRQLKERDQKVIAGEE
jgi:hypothetical protein